MKPARQPNYTEDEYLLLLNTISLFKDVIESKDTNASAWKQKDLAWEKVSQLFNSQNNIFRNKRSLKKLYDNRKQRNPTADMKLIKNNSHCNKNKYDMSVIKVDDHVEQQIITVQDEYQHANSNDWDKNSLIFKNEQNADICLGKRCRGTRQSNKCDFGSCDPLSLCDLPSPGNDMKTDLRRKRPKRTTQLLARQYSKLTYLKTEVAKEELQLMKIKIENERLKNEEQERYAEIRNLRTQEEYEIRKRNLQLDMQIKLLQIKQLKRQLLM